MKTMVFLRYALLAGLASSLSMSCIAQAQRLETTRLPAAGTVLEVASGPSSGTSYLIDKERGLLVTNAHVVADDSIFVFVDQQRAAIARKLVVDTLADLAIIQIAPEFVRNRPALVIRALPPVLGEPITVVGFPLKRDLTVTAGIVASLSADALFVDALINPGNSGGPVLDMNGQVLATATFITRDEAIGPGLGAAVSNARLPRLIETAIQLLLSLPDLDTADPLEPRPTWRLGWDEVRTNVLAHGTYWYASWDDFRSGPFNIEVSTPGSNWAVWSGQDSIIGSERFKRDQKSGASAERYSTIGSLRNWEQYVGDPLSPVVAIQINPRPAEKTSSVIGNLLLGIALGVSGPQIYGFSGDVYSAKLTRDGVPIKKITGGHAPQRFWVESRWLSFRDVADFGYYTFPAEAFAPRADMKFAEMVLEIVNRKDLKVHRFRFPEVTVARIWGDFYQSFSSRFPEKKYHTVRLFRACKEIPGYVPDCRSGAFVERAPK